MKPKHTETIDKRGRVRVYLGKDHPYANSGGWQWRNRLALAQDLGRKLSRSEDGHHRNGNRADDTKGNLRVKDHAEHAREHALRRRRDVLGRFVSEGSE